VSTEVLCLVIELQVAHTNNSSISQSINQFTSILAAQRSDRAVKYMTVQMKTARITKTNTAK